VKSDRDKFSAVLGDVLEDHTEELVALGSIMLALTEETEDRAAAAALHRRSEATGIGQLLLKHLPSVDVLVSCDAVARFGLPKPFCECNSTSST
jgi:hypothetical protein